MTDVHDLLARTHDALGASGVTLDDARRDALLTGIRRRRRRRHTAEALGVCVLVLAVGTGGWFGLTRDRAPQPAQSPTATADPTPTSAPTSVADATPAPDAPGLLPAVVMPAGTLESSTPGWVLTRQAPSYQTGDGEWSDEPTANVVDAVAPDGTRYRVLDLPVDRYVDLVRWDAGTTTALVMTSGPEGRVAARLDLLTGEVTPLPGLPSPLDHVGRTAAGDDVWSDEIDDRLVVHDGTAVVRELPFVRDALVDPTGTRVAGTRDGRFVAVDVTTGQVTELAPPTDEMCSPVGWHGSDVVVSCLGFEASSPVVTSVFRVDADAPGTEGASLGLPVDRLPTGRGWTLADGRIAVGHSLQVECTRGWGLLDPVAGTLQDVPVPAPDVPELSVRVQAAGDVVLVAVSRSCSGDATPLQVLRYDATTGAQVEIAAPPSDADVPAGGSSWATGTVSSVIASR